eukprot:2656393-Lingulodinium_polyedra.AAC.1
MAFVSPTLLLSKAVHRMSLVGRGRGEWSVLSALCKVDRNCRPRLGKEYQEIWVRANNVCHHMRPK